MRKKRILSLLLAAACTAALLAGCGGKQSTDQADTPDTANNSDHPVITMNAPYRNASQFYELVHEKYPEINLEIIPYNGYNMTSYLTNMRACGQMTDIFFNTYYVPGRMDDESDFLDLSGYDFTGNFAQSRLREVTSNGAVYMLPLSYNALGITYNKTLLDKHGWTLPTSLKEMETLKKEAEAAGVIFCRDQLQLPGYGFQYLCNILDTGFLSTIDGMEWQDQFLSGKANVSDTPKMVQAMQLLERWRDLGLLNADGTPDSDSSTKKQMLEGNTLFLVGNSNSLADEKEDGSKVTDEFRLMPYLSEDGDQNVFILNVSRYVGLNKSLGEEGNAQKLEDALKVMEVISTEEGINSMDPTQSSSRLLPLKDVAVTEDNYYATVIDELNSGHTANFIYTGWENIIVDIGQKMIDYVKGNATLDDVITCFDENQYKVTENKPDSYTTATETIGLEDCARAIGISFAQATGSEAALISLNEWTYDPDAYSMNDQGVNGCLFPTVVGEQELTSILPTGWKGNIQTVTLTGARIKELAETGFDYKDERHFYPYLLVTKGGEALDDDTTYTIPICGVTDAVAEEGKLSDSGVLGLDAAKTYFSQFETLSAKDIVWE